jgi:hypothetical protein
MREHISVIERFDAPKIRVWKDGESLAFGKRDRDLNLIDRVLDPSISGPMAVLESMDRSVFQDGFVYEFSCFDSVKPVSFEYERMPKDGLVYMCKRKGQSIIERPDFDMQFESAVLWQGNLSDRMVDQFVGIAKASLSAGIGPSRVLEIVGATPTLNESATYGLVIRAGKWNPVYFSINDSVNESFRENAIQRRDPIDFHGIILCDFIDFCEVGAKLDEAIGHVGDVHERFLTSVSNLYLQYMADRPGIFDGVEISDRDFGVDEKLIMPEVSETFKGHVNNKKVFQMILQSLYSPKKKPTGTLTESILQTINRIRNRITEAIRITSGDEPITFSEYLLTKKI